jgi:hypothetical protein
LNVQWIQNYQDYLSELGRRHDEKIANSIFGEKCMDVLARIKQLILLGNYKFTLKAQEEMAIEMEPGDDW